MPWQREEKEQICLGICLGKREEKKYEQYALAKRRKKYALAREEKEQRLKI